MKNIPAILCILVLAGIALLLHFGYKDIRVSERNCQFTSGVISQLRGVDGVNEDNIWAFFRAKGFESNVIVKGLSIEGESGVEVQDEFIEVLGLSVRGFSSIEILDVLAHKWSEDFIECLIRQVDRFFGGEVSIEKC